MYTPVVNFAGTYTVYCSDGYGCTNQASFVMEVDTCTGMREVSTASWLEVYPNPSFGLFYVNTSLEGLKTLQVLNTLGQCIYLHRTETQYFYFDVSDKAKGLYTVIIESKGMRRQLKLVVQ